MATALAGFVLLAASASATPRGHLKPLGAWRDSEGHVEVVDAVNGELPNPVDFYKKYCDVEKGIGKPVLFKGLVKDLAAEDVWNDDALLTKLAGKDKVKVEWNLKETRVEQKAVPHKTLGAFLKNYNTSDIYLVSAPPKPIMNKLKFPSFLQCGGQLDFLDAPNMWMGRGGSKSVVHYDEQDNINCMYAGKKQFKIFHPQWRKKFEKDANLPKNRFGWVDTEIPSGKGVPGYGAFFGKLDVDAVDLIKFPGWIDVNWWYADLTAGDCLYLPSTWYHQVVAEPIRSINFHMWYFRPKPKDFKANAKKCVADETTWGDCAPWTHETNSKYGDYKKKHTKCKKTAVRSTEEL